MLIALGFGALFWWVELLFSILAQVTAKPGETIADVLRRPEHRGEVQEISRLSMTVAIIGVVSVLGLILLFIYRRRKFEKEREVLARERETATPKISAWEEAGRRLRVSREDDEEDLDSGGSSPESLRGRAGGVEGIGGGEDVGKDASELGGGTPAVAGSGKFRQRSVEGASGQFGDGAQRPVVLVTGGAKRVGRAIVREFARNGFDVWFTYNASEHDARDVSREVSALGRKVTSFRVDFGETGEVEEIARQLAQTLPRLDVLVHNAAVYEATALEEFDSELAAKHFRVNALAPLVLTAHLRKLLSESPFEGGGSVVAMLDIHAMGKPRRNFAAYTMSKAALHEMVLNLAKDLAPSVRVNGVAPGVVAWEEPEIDTNGPGFDAEGSGGASKKPSDEQRRYLRRIPLGRFGEPEDAAKAVYWLATQATYVTGQVVRVDGGRWLT